MNVTIDASVFVATTRSKETQHSVSRQFVEEIQRRQIDLFCPLIVLPECAAAIARPTGEAELGEQLVALVTSLLNMNLANLDSTLAHRAAQIAAYYRLKGADAIYVAVAEAFDATLVTWDNEMLERGASIVSTMSPAQWLAEQSSLN
jgi:predicted nucleic acid-binding protein